MREVARREFLERDVGRLQLLRLLLRRRRFDLGRGLLDALAIVGCSISVSSFFLLAI
jgi:hypothetical protein